MKYLDELKRAMKIAGFFALGIFIGTAGVPWIMESDKTYANAKLLGTLWGLLGVYAGGVALLFISEIMRTKRMEKKKAGKK